MRSQLLATALLAGIAACGSDRPASVVEHPKPAFGTFGIDTAQLDTAVKPGDDFFNYVNGKWIATAQMPADRARYGVTDALADKAESDVHALLDDLVATPSVPASVEQKIADFYRSSMDEKTIEERGMEPVKHDLEAISAARTKADLTKLMGHQDYTGPVGLNISPDPDDPTAYVVNVTQSGLGMPGRDYYLSTGERFDAYRTAYRTYIATILKLAGDARAATSADAVIALETKLARVHWARERQRDVQATNNPVDRAGLTKMIPALDWDAMLGASGLAGVQRFVVNETTALRDGAALLNTQPVDVWKKYLAFHLVDDYASYLPRAVDEASFAFHSKAMRGVEVQRDRWKRSVALLNNQIGEGVGQLYVAKHFPPDNKARMETLVSNLRTAMGARLETLNWMDDATRAAAQKKLATFDPRIGYPSKWRDYSALTIAPGTLFENVRNARQFDWDRQVARLGDKVDRTEWHMTPQTVNAYYSPDMNQVTFPAAILQPPFFDPNADAAVNYGAIGAVIGHEMGHGFDDQGREYDYDTGRIRNWWTPETNQKFLEQIRRLGAQYAAFCPLEGLCVNGQLTMGENIGDLGGLEMAYTAYQLSLKGGAAPVIEGFTGDQRFFMAHAQVWRAIMRDDAMRNLLLTNPHSPPAARGSIPERNMDAWYAAFGVKEGDRLFIKPEDRVKIW